MHRAEPDTQIDAARQGGGTTPMLPSSIRPTTSEAVLAASTAATVVGCGRLGITTVIRDSLVLEVLSRLT